MMFVSLLGKKSSKIPSFLSIMNKVKKQFVAEQAAKMARKESKKYLAKLGKENSTLENISKIFDVEVLKTKNFSRSDTPNFLKNKSKEISKMFSLGKNKFGNIILSDRFILYKVLLNPKSDMKNFVKQKAEIKKRVLEEKRNLLYNRYLESLRKSSKIMVSSGFKL